METTAHQSVETYPVFDAHVDSLQLALDMGRDLGEEGAGHLDLVRGKRGGLRSVVFVAWTDPDFLKRGQGAASTRSTQLLDCLDALCERHPEQVSWVKTGDELDEAHATGRIAAIAGIEGGHAFEENPEQGLETFFERGGRVLTLCWNNHLSWIRSCQACDDSNIPAGLSERGRSLVRRMNELGMIIDLSHAGEQSFYDALEVTKQPVIASHSGCRAVSEHPRNLNDKQLRTLSANGGVVGIVFCTPFLDHNVRALEQECRQSSGYQALEADNGTALHLLQGEYLQAQLQDLPLSKVVEHTLHAIEVAGIDHVGIGSDFDGIQRRPEGLTSAAEYGSLASALQQQGLSSEGLHKLFHANFERVFRQVCRNSGA